jgi:hypothetical protein
LQDSKELQEAAAATDDLFSQLAVYTSPAGDDGDGSFVRIFLPSRQPTPKEKYSAVATTRQSLAFFSLLINDLALNVLSSQGSDEDNLVSSRSGGGFGVLAPAWKV